MSFKDLKPADVPSDSSALNSRTETQSSPSGSPPLVGGGSKCISAFGTIIDMQYRVAEGSHDLLVMTQAHVEKVAEIEDRLETDQLGAHCPLVPGYKLLHKIGRGAYGTVWEAQSIDSDIGQVAIKFFSCSRWEPMHREVSRISRLEGCTGVMSFKHYADKKADPPYYVMPFARNGSLADLIKNRGTMTVDESLDMFQRIVQTMAFVHTKGVIHCDLKPANILLNESNEPLVADFGQALLGSQESGAFGTLFYMPPDQAAPNQSLPDATWDVYALGAILFEMLTGSRPRASAETVARLSTIKDVRDRLNAYRTALAEMPRVNLRQAVQATAPANARKVDSSLSDIVERCLSVDPAKRPRSAADLLDMLRHRNHWLRRRSSLVGAAVVTVLFIGLMAGLGIYLANQLFDQRRDDADRQAQATLNRIAHIAGQLIEEKLHDRVQFVVSTVEDAEVGDQVEDCDMMAALQGARDKLKQMPEIHDPILENRDIFNDWLKSKTLKMPWYFSDKNARGMALIAVVDGNRGYWLGRLEPNGKPFTRSFWSRGENFFRRNWAFRDYFNGKQNYFAEEGKHIGHEPIDRVHISQVFRSRTHDSWRIDVSAPIHDKDGKIVAILTVNIDVHKDLLRWLTSDKETNTAGDNTLAGQEKIILVNERGCWATHPVAERRPEDFDNKDPDPVYKNEDWFHASHRGAKLYRDPFNDETRSEEYYLSYVPLHPFEVVTKDANDPDPRRWVLGVQMRKSDVEEPLRIMRQKIYRIGVVTAILIGGMVTALWIWWIRTLRRQELLVHG